MTGDFATLILHLREISVRKRLLTDYSPNNSSGTAFFMTNYIYCSITTSTNATSTQIYRNSTKRIK
jgi:hypothetical protein